MQDSKQDLPEFAPRMGEQGQAEWFKFDSSSLYEAPIDKEHNQPITESFAQSRKSWEKVGPVQDLIRNETLKKNTLGNFDQ